MGAVDKLIARVELQAETLAEYRQLDDRRRSRITELERKLGDAEREQDIARVEIETLRQERDLARAEIMTWRVSDDSLRKDRDHWKQARQDAIEAGELMQAEIETLRQQLDAAQAEVTGERLAAEERARELERLREDNARWQRVVETRGRELYDCGKDLSAIWAEMLQVDIAFPAESSLVQSLQILRESHVAARAEIETLRQQLADAQREAVNLQKLHDHLRPRLDAAQGQLTRERLDAEEQGREIETLRQQLANAQQEASDEFAERQVLQHEASDVYVELERLRAFVEVMRGLLTEEYADQRIIAEALDELDAGTTQSAPAAEPLDAEGGA